jgi:hypothetical protein
MTNFKLTEKVFPDGRVRSRYYVNGKRVSKNEYFDRVDYSTYNSSWNNSRNKDGCVFNYSGFCC